MNFIRLNRICFFAVLLFCAGFAFAEISFSGLNLNESDEVLFALSHHVPGSIEYSTVFKTKIKNGTAEYFPRPLTCFPERMEILGESQKLQVRNRYGSALYDFNTEELKWTELATSIPENFSSAKTVETSSSGMWACSLEHTDMFKGRLVITEIPSGKKIVLNEDCSFSCSSVPVKWADDGKNFIYEKNGALYLCNAEGLFKDRLIQEEFRKITYGTINSVEWNGSDSIIYISSDLIFEVGTKEIISLGLYSQFIPLGKILGRIPQRFDSTCDRFWVNKKTNDFFIIRRDENISWYKFDLTKDSGSFVQTICSVPFFEKGMTALGFDIFWTASGMPAICAKLATSGSGIENFAVYELNTKGLLLRRIFVPETYSDIAINPGKTYVAFSFGESVIVFNTNLWKSVLEVKGEKTASLVWRNNESLCIGGVRSVKELNIKDSTLKTLFASSASFAWWTEQNEIAFKENAKSTLVVNEKGVWKNESLAKENAVLQNESYRIFVGTTKNSLYKNALYVRTLTGKSTTKALIEQTALPKAPRNKVAIVFDADESADGLDSILALCNEYNIKCTFFFNGEFIRRYPEESKTIAQSQHECAAIFFTNVNLLDKSVYRDKRFVAKGLARLEDEFYSCTGKELSLFWHAPFNKADKKVRDEGAAAGYTYIDFNEPVIIQIGAGNTKTASTSVLHENFNLLINELFATGAELVTVSGLY